MIRRLAAIALAALALAAAAEGAGPSGSSAPPDPPAATADAPSAAGDSEALQGEVESLKEQLEEAKARLEGLLRIKLSGYLQGRYQVVGSDAPEADPHLTSTLRNDGFSVARGRLRAQHDTRWSRFVLEIDAVPSGVSLRDAEAHVKLGESARIVLGQMKWPFGYEAQQSSADREFPERSRVEGAFQAGERDRGVRVEVRYAVLDLSAGVFNGNGTENTLVRTTAGTVEPRGADGDNDRNKDLVGRLGFDLGFLAGGASGWFGETFQIGGVPEGAPAGTPRTPGRTHQRTRWGADLQAYLELLPIGRTALKGEYIAGKTPVIGGAEAFGESANGWYALLVQNVGLADLIAIRWDRFDPRSDLAAADAPGVDASPPETNRIDTLGVALVHHFDPSLKLTVAYEWPMTEVAGDDQQPHDNLFTLQLQAQF